MVKETNGSNKIAGLEMSDLEAMGHVKFDILGVNLLDKITNLGCIDKSKFFIPSKLSMSLE